MMRFYFGHHKCATLYLHQEVFGAICKHLGLTSAFVYSPEFFGNDFNAFSRDNHYSFISYINADWQFIEPLEMPFRAVHVIRDPRDVLVSAYFSHLHSHPTFGWPELVEFRKKLTNLSAKDGLLAEIEFIAELPTNGFNLSPFRNMLGWDYADKRILELRYEDMVSNPRSFFVNIGHHLELGISDEEFLEIVHANSFSKFSGRAVGEEDEKHHYRKGQPGDWRHHFDEDLTKAFKERFPRLLSTLGYESDDNW